MQAAEHKVFQKNGQTFEVVPSYVRRTTKAAIEIEATEPIEIELKPEVHNAEIGALMVAIIILALMFIFWYITLPTLAIAAAAYGLKQYSKRPKKIVINNFQK